VQCVAVWCSVLQCVAVCCSVLQCGAVWCSVRRCIARCCSVLQCVARCCSVVQCVARCCSVVQCVTVWIQIGKRANVRFSADLVELVVRSILWSLLWPHTRISHWHLKISDCNTSQHTATHYLEILHRNTLHHAATHGNTPLKDPAETAHSNTIVKNNIRSRKIRVLGLGFWVLGLGFRV